MRRISILLFSIALSFSLSAEWTILESHTIPGKASGLAFDGTFFYFGIYGANGDQVHRFDPATGISQLLFTNPLINDSYGMTYDGQYLWITDHQSPSTTPAYAMQLDFQGNIISQFNLPDHYMSGIAYDNGNFWVQTYYPDPGMVYQVNGTGTILSQFIPPDNQPWDICVDGNNLWIVDYWINSVGMIHKVDMSGNLLESYLPETQRPAGIVHDGTYLWYVDGPLGNNSTLYKVDPSGTGTPVIFLGWDQYDFGNVTIGQPVSVDLPVSNNGTADLVISDFDFSLDDFYTDAVFPLTISPGNQVSVPIFFNPSLWGPFSCVLFIESNDPISPVEEVNLSGYGVNLEASIVVNPTTLNYGSVRVNAVTGRYIEISNQGAGNLEISQFDFDNNQFYLDDAIQLPLLIAPAGTEDVRIWFNPQSSGNISGQLTIHSNDPNALTTAVALSGNGDDSQFAMGQTLWQHTITTGYDNSPKAIAPIQDINGDDKNDVIICSEDNFVRCFNGNASGIGDILWETEIYSGNVYHQNSLMIAPDLNNDGFEDVIVGTTGGDRAIRAICGKTGNPIWTFFSNIYGSGGWVYQVDISQDFNGDDVLDVVAATGNDGSGTGPQRVFCLNGTNGSVLWEFYVAGPKFSCIGVSDINNDGISDVLGGGSNSSETVGKVWAINGSNGAMLWEFNTAGSSVWALAEVEDFSGDGINDFVAGDFGGNYYGIVSSSGSSQWSGTIGIGLIIRFEKLEDVNGNGFSDIAIARSSQNNAIVIDGGDGSNIWLQSLANQPWVVDKIGDLTGDGINDIVWGTLYQSNFGYFMNGATGEILAQIPISSAVDAIAGIPDVASDGSWEMVCGGRNGEVICISGGVAVGVGTLEGTISLNGGTGNVGSTIVQVGTTTITVDPSGYYNAALSPGFYDVSFYLESYETVLVEDLEILSGQATVIDVTLNYCFAPQNLSYEIEQNNVVLAWDAPQSSRAVESYKVYRDGSEIAEVTVLTYTDLSLPAATYEYFVTAIYADGQESEASNTIFVEITGSGDIQMPVVTRLFGNYPNPFNPTTVISFSLSEKDMENAKIDIFNLKGQLVRTLLIPPQQTIQGSVSWDGRDQSDRPVSSGIYFYRMVAGEYRANGKCIMLK